MKNRELLDKGELIVYLNGKMTFDTLGRLTREGKIPFVKFPGIRRYFYEKEAIDRWLDSLQCSSDETLNVIKYDRQIKAI